MKPILNQQLIDKYILDEFGKLSNLLTINETNKMIELIYTDKLTLEKVKLWYLLGGDLMIKGTYQKTILHSASYMGQLDIIEYVLDKEVDVDNLNINNQTPLSIASQCGHIEVINLLLERSANINHQAKNGWSALHYACICNHLKVIKVLVEKGIDIHLIGHYYRQNETALDVAKHRGHHKIIDYLTPFYNK